MDLRNYGLSYFCETNGINPIGYYTIERIAARELLLPERIDLMAKIKFVEAYDTGKGYTFANELYKRNIEACTMGMFAEIGDEKKQTYVDFVEIFKDLIEHIKNQGVDERISIIPIGKRNILLNGAHRVAIAAYYGMDVPVIRFNMNATPMDTEFFRKRMIIEEDIDFYVQELCRWRKDLYFLCLWPSASPDELREKVPEVISKKGNIVHSKKININYNGLFNLIPQVYSSKEWIGNIDDHFISATPKVESVNGEYALQAILFQYPSLSEVKELKEQLRSLFNIDEHSLHITDFPEETLEMTKLLYNSNSISFLINAMPFKYSRLNRLIVKYKEQIEKNEYDTEDYLIDSSCVLGLYGVREPDDLDYLTLSDDLLLSNESINNHINELEFHKKSLDELITTPTCFFYYLGMKVITLEILLSFKKNRNSRKDKNDIKILSDLLNNHTSLIGKIYSAETYVRRKFRNVLFKTLKRLPGGGTKKSEIYTIS